MLGAHPGGVRRHHEHSYSFCSLPLSCQLRSRHRPVLTVARSLIGASQSVASGSGHSLAGISGGHGRQVGTQQNHPRLMSVRPRCHAVTNPECTGGVVSNVSIAFNSTIESCKRSKA
jgi:hypothetical protein